MKIERELAWPCHDCKVRGSSFCNTLIDGASPRPRTEQDHIAQFFLNVEKDEVIRHDSSKIPSGPFVLCQGWAYSYYQLPDGRRQILSVVIPGDPLSAFALLGTHPGHSFRAATDARLCQFTRDDIWKEIVAAPSAYDTLGQFCSAEMDHAIAASINLARRNPVARLAGFLHRVVSRLLSRKIMTDTGVYPFPLTHTVIADATGLSTRDVDDAVVALRNDGVLDLSNRKLTVLNRAAFERNAVGPVL